MPRKKRDQGDAAADPDSLVRQSAGAYRSADGRFTVEQSDANWFLVDTQQTNELGQELIHGPFATLKQARAAVPGARNVTPLPRTRRRPPAAKPAPKPAPPSWIDRLPEAERAEISRLIAALEREGVADAEALVRRDRQANVPAVVTRLIERRLDELVTEVADSAPERERARALVERVAAVLSGDRPGARQALPGWALVEIGAEPPPPNRRIRLGS